WSAPLLALTSNTARRGRDHASKGSACSIFSNADAHQTWPCLAQDPASPAAKRTGAQFGIRPLCQVPDLCSIRRWPRVSRLQRPKTGTDEEFCHRAARFSHRHHATLDYPAKEILAKLGDSAHFWGHPCSTSRHKRVAGDLQQRRLLVSK